MDNNLPYLEYNYIMDNLKSYASPKAKLTYMLKKGELIRLRRGLYISNDSPAGRFTLANRIYGPSYVSFESALAWYGLIPEKTVAVTSACMGKNRNKSFDTPLGSFIFRDVPQRVYPYDIVRGSEQGVPFLIATKEKALCDTLARIAKINTKDDLVELLFADLRLDDEAIKKLDSSDICFLASLYKKKTVTLFCMYLQEAAR